MNKCLYAYAWDFLDEGIDNVLKLIKSLEVDVVAVATSYHAGKFILPHNPKRRVHFIEDGTCYFTPRPHYYSETALKPAAASIIGSRDILAEISEGCLRHGIKLTAWTVFLHNTRLGMLHPNLTARNAFGDRYLYSLCPAQPKVRAYALGLAKDIASNYEIETLFLESLAYLGFFHGYHHEFYGVKLSPGQESLLSLCFCDACREEAANSGVDADSVARLVRDLLRGVFEDEVAHPGLELDEITEAHPELDSYLKVRCNTVTNLVREIKSVAGRSGVKVDVYGPVYEPSCARAFVEGTDIAGLAQVIDHYVVPGGHPNPAFVEGEVRFVKDRIDPEKMILSVNLLPQSAPSKDVFLAKLAAARNHGLSGCNIYNYSTVPLARLDWIKENHNG